MKKINILKHHRSFSLIEVLVFVTVLSFFFVTAMAVATFNIRNTKVQEHKILATRYAEEATEWIRYEKESDWSIFVTRDPAATGTTYCLNNSNGLNWDIASPCGDVYALGTPAIFKREVYIKDTGLPPGVSQVDVTITVSWIDYNTTFNVSVPTVFRLLE